ncbi:alpha/beta hydrolase fold domain-containing protein [Nocardia uniformis]|uniref:Alpha/beta hydrolase fold domain-containing protein n=1 Tax=Nocardia uniformis TaxID=53432 RepID=A0A849BT58_9NOCA|nr:alpha/beta hydrolase fold domain-containing protein [Nocardia uniformis]NNH69773.1 alpha/beta hydrolase fold domain-containing protein [Nocardia uniformis]
MPEISLPLPVARAVLNSMFRVVFHYRLPFTAQRKLMDLGAAAQLLPRGTRVESIRLGDRPAERIATGPVSDAITVLYLHGGGYTVGSPTTHRALAAVLSREIGCRVHVPDYRLAPEHPFPAALDDAEAVGGRRGFHRVHREPRALACSPGAGDPGRTRREGDPRARGLSATGPATCSNTFHRIGSGAFVRPTRRVQPGPARVAVATCPPNVA